MDEAADKIRRYFVCIVLIILTMAAYWPVLDSEFAGYDDDQYVLGNPFVHAGLTIKSISWAFTSTRMANWHPLTWLSHMLDVELYGLNPTGHHLTNLLLHLTNVLLLFALLRLMTGATWRSGLVAALFAVHPLHVESVAWVSERKDVLSTLFWMLTSIAYVRYARKPSVGKYVPVILLFALGLMAKPMLVSLPIIFLLMDYWPLVRGWKHHSPSPSTRQTKRDALQRSSERTNTLERKHTAEEELVPDSLASSLPSFRSVLSTVPEKIPLFALAAASCIVTLVAQKAGGAIGSMEVYPLGVRVANALVSYIAYLWKMLWPQGLAVYYPHPINTLPLWQSVGSAIILVFISLLAVLQRRTRPYMLVGWLWYVLTLIPVIGLVQVGGQAMADRYTYIPLIGIFVMVIWGVSDLARRQRTVLAACAVIVLTVMAVCTHIQSGYWHDGVTLFEHALRCTRPNHVSHMNLAVCLDRKGRYSEAIAHFRKALSLRPDTPEIHYNMAITLMNLDRPDDAISHYREAVRLNPRYVEAHYNLGLALDEKGMPQAAIRHYEQALHIQPDFVQARNNLAIAYYSIGDYARAWKEVQKVRKYGFEPHPDFIAALKECLPEPHSEGKP